QVVAIEQNGEKEKSEKSGRSGALPWIGEGHYRTTIQIGKTENAELLFDGAMSEPIVYVNGKEAGRWAYGYNAFRINITPYLKVGENKIEVDLNNVEESSRWYPGGGIYRPVKLIMKSHTSIRDWGTYMRTIEANAKRAKLSVDTQVDGVDNQGNLAVEVSILNPKGYVEIAGHADVNVDGKVHLDMEMKNPQLWSPESPFLYKMITRLYRDNQVIDEQSQNVGIRTLAFSKEHGFQLNGVSRKFKGVCLHHDLGPLGAAVNKAALIRQAKILKDMGCDAIRTSHNMPSTMQMEVYDSLGLMVMAESFDMWIYPKCKNGYARFFKEWSDKDIENLVLNHRNHPSLVMWSIGNEIPEQWSEEGVKISRHLQDICHQLDPSRPVTQGMDRAESALKSGFAQVMDIPGFNYRVHKYDNNIKQLPIGFLLGSETASTISSRGVYKFPVKISNKATYPDGQCSSYDTEYCSWSNLPDADFYMQDERSWSIGQFVWTGFDYLGEPTPYDGYWPS
ncbi:MAG: beta-galactosidase, partial [Prevotella sp.]|nr:beta-galactosidase [Prevotella sp.]